MSWKPEVQIGTSERWWANSLAFATEAEADAYADEYAIRWMGVRAVRVVESDEAPTYTFRRDGLVKIRNQ